MAREPGWDRSGRLTQRTLEFGTDEASGPRFGTVGPHRVVPPPAGPYWDQPEPGDRPGRPGQGGRGHRPRRRWRRRQHLGRWLKGTAVVLVAVLIFRRALASVVLLAMSAGLHLVGLNVHLPSIRFGWPWQSVTAGRTSNVSVGPWVLQKIEGNSRPALGTANFTFTFTHKVSKSIGIWPCWYSSTFYAVARASATVDLNPGPAWWRPSTGHYQLRVLSRPGGGRPGQVSVQMMLPPPQLPRSAQDVTINNFPSKPLSTQHSWTYPGMGCGVLLRPQFAESVLYAQAQQLAFSRASHDPQITRPLIASAQAQAVKTVRDNFIQPTVNALGYRLAQFTIRWAPPGGRSGGRTPR